MDRRKLFGMLAGIPALLVAGAAKPTEKPQIWGDQHHSMKCPHCDSRLTTKQAIIILNGTGFRRMARIRLPDGSQDIREAGFINPLKCEILD